MFWRRFAETLAMVIMLDHASVLLLPHISKHARWLWLHALVNWTIAILTLPACSAFLREPNNAMIVDDGVKEFMWYPSSKYPMTLVVALHVYHIVGPFRLTDADWFHHMLFITCLAIPGAIYDWGILANWFAFFACGVPGAVDYTLLALQKANRVIWIPQKRVSAIINTWVRGPGILMGASIGYVFLMSGAYGAPAWALILQLLLLPFNAIYYNRQSVVNHIVHEFRPVTHSQMWEDMRRRL